MGQIVRGSKLGEILYKFSLNKNFVNFGDIGSYDGEGSTKCIMDGLLTRADSSCLYSLEANKEFFQKAMNFWGTTLLTYKIPKLKLIYGRIIEVEELLTVEEVENRDFEKHYPYLQWRERNIKEYGECPNVMEQLPEQFDLVVYDGGQFSTQSEWNKLKSRVKVAVFDDTKTLKTKKCREEVLKSSDWEVLEDSEDRNGFMIAVKKEFKGVL